MKVLVYGAGVIGSYLTHVLLHAGNDVTLLARGNWKHVVETKGLIIRHHLQRKTTVDHPRVIERIDFSQHYDVVFSVMSYHQTGEILNDLADMNADAIVMVGNNLSAAEMERSIRSRSKVHKQILFGFQGTAGKREADHVVCERMGNGRMSIGFLDTRVPENVKQLLEGLFQRTGYQLCWRDSMDSYLKCHAAAILPLCYLGYGAGCDYKKTSKEQRRLSMAASAEAYDLLVRLGYSIVPEGDDTYYRSGAKKQIMSFMLFVMSKTIIGELVGAAHCRHAVSEMEALDTAWTALRLRRPDFPMPNWDMLREAMPDWQSLHQIYDAREPFDAAPSKNV